MQIHDGWKLLDGLEFNEKPSGHAGTQLRVFPGAISATVTHFVIYFLFFSLKGRCFGHGKNGVKQFL